MNTTEAILTRRSVRHYEAGFKMPESDLTTILRAGMYAPSAMNKQPWEFLVVTDSVLLTMIRDNHPHAAFLTDAGIGIFICVDLSKEYNGMGITDVSMASQNIMLQAHDLGYGTCYCGIYPDKCEEFNDLLKLPEHIQPIGLIALGKPVKEVKQPEERYNSALVHFNQW